MFPTHKNLRQMIETAMQDRSPQMYARLKASGELLAAVQERADAAQESYLAALSEQPKAEVMRRQLQSPMDQMAERTMQQKAAAETALAQALEFPSESATDETTSPL